MIDSWGTKKDWTLLHVGIIHYNHDLIFVVPFNTGNLYIYNHKPCGFNKASSEAINQWQSSTGLLCEVVERHDVQASLNFISRGHKTELRSIV